MQYLYSDGDLYHFMDGEKYDQIALNEETIGDALKFVKENEEVKICSYQGRSIRGETAVICRTCSNRN